MRTITALLRRSRPHRGHVPTLRPIGAVAVLLLAAFPLVLTGAAQAATPAPAPGAAVAAQLTEVARLRAPVATTVDGDDLYVAEQAGVVRALRGGQLDPTPVVDLSGEVTSGGERGLLGIAVSPDRGFLYVNLTNLDGNTSIREYPLVAGRANPAAGRELMEIEDFAPNHNGGQLAFGPDGRLYIATGDGGGAGDPRRNGQNLSTLLGKILRVDPRPTGGQPYGVPADNPFVGQAGARPEIWAYGLRNPWRFSFDPATGDLWLGDVGQNAWEEIDVMPAGRGGANFGWNLREGRHPFPPGSTTPPPPGAVDPVIEYGRDLGCTVIGGPVYRGDAIPDLRGSYLYGDFCGGWVRAVATSGGLPTGAPVDLGVEVESLSSFGTGPDGEVYLLSLDGPVYRLTP